VEVSARHLLSRSHVFSARMPILHLSAPLLHHLSWLWPVFFCPFSTLHGKICLNLCEELTIGSDNRWQGKRSKTGKRWRAMSFFSLLRHALILLVDRLSVRAMRVLLAFVRNRTILSNLSVSSSNCTGAVYLLGSRLQAQQCGGYLSPMSVALFRTSARSHH
jgi:hypothetical protein